MGWGRSRPTGTVSGFRVVFLFVCLFLSLNQRPRQGGCGGPALTVCGAAVSVSISSWVNQTFPVVWGDPGTRHPGWGGDGGGGSGQRGKVAAM